MVLYGGVSRVWQVGQVPWAPLEGGTTQQVCFLTYATRLVLGDKKVTRLFFNYSNSLLLSVALPLLHCNLDRGAISVLAICAISPRYTPGAFLSEISGKYMLCTTIKVPLTANLPEEGKCNIISTIIFFKSPLLCCILIFDIYCLK